jgi:gliding motility-associated-like protein
MKKRDILIITTLIFSFFAVYGQKSSRGISYAQPKWTVKDPFEQKVFIENNEGQFDGKAGSSNGILYSTRIAGVDVYFTGNGLVYRYDKYEKKGLKESEEEKEKQTKPETFLFREQWSGANPHPIVIPEEEVSFYYTYHQGKAHTTLAHAFKKLLYKNIYPGIDVEYSFKEDKKGIEYAIIVHPGGDLGKAVLSYPDATTVKETSEGIEWLTPMGAYVDYVPEKSYYEENGKPLIVNMLLTNSAKEEVFDAGSYDHSKTLVIDPFKVSPAFTGYNGGYDIAYDDYGDVYAYGSYLPFQEVKINSSGTILWTYNATTPIPSGQYAGFAVDAVSGSSYCANAGDPVIQKVSSSGFWVDSIDVTSKMNEIWRVSFNHCDNQIILGGGGTAPGNYEMATLDTTVKKFNPVNVLGTVGGHHDVSLLCLDNVTGYCYMATAQSNTFADWNNGLIKCPLPAFLPLKFTTIPDGYSFYEGATINYVDGVSGHTCAMNGMCASPNWLYLYDGAKLSRFNKNTGVFITSKTVSGTQFNWGGIDVDMCDNLYLGNNTNIEIYDSAMNNTGAIAAGYQVYALRVMPNNQLCATGLGFVSTYTITTNALSISKTTTKAACGTPNGKATAKLTGCGSDSSQYNYLWSNGVTTQTDTGLAAGIYTVTISSGCDFKFTDTVQIGTGGLGGFSITSTQVNPKCNGNNNGSATVTATGASGTYTYTWNTGQTTSSVTGLSAGTYTVTVTDSAGCVNTKAITITQPASLTATFSSVKNISCNGNTDGSLGTSPTGGTSPYTYSWSNGATGSSNTGLTVGSYTLTVTDNNGCIATAAASISQPALLTTTITLVNVNCNGSKTGSATTNTSGGTPKYTYSWNNGSTLSNNTGLSAGTYTVTVTDTNGCSVTATVTITQPPPITTVMGPNINVKCNGGNNGNTEITVSGGSPGYTYTWTDGQTNSSATGLTAGTYSVTVIDASGCSLTASTIITQPKPLLDSIVSTTNIPCTGGTGSAVVGVKGGTGTYTYNWAPTGGTSATATGLSAGIYTVTVQDSNGCLTMVTDTIKKTGKPVVSITGTDSVCQGNTATITASGGATYTWSTSATTSSITVTPTSTTTYTVQVSNGGPCFVDTAFTVSVVPVPAISIASGSTTICAGENANIGVTGGGTYLWSPGGSTNSSLTVSPATTTTYTVAVSNGHCTKDTTIKVTVNPPPTVAITPPQKVCPGEPVTITATGGGTYVWSNGATTSSITIIPTGAASYTVVVSNGCKDSATTSVSIDASSSLSACCDTVISPGDSTNIYAYGQSNYTWSPSTGLSCTTCPNPWATPTVTTTYTVTSTDSAGCPVARTITIAVEIPCADFTVPNIFTPNNDGRNDDFVIKVLNPTSYSIIIYDRWGKEMYKSTDPTVYWNGDILNTNYIVPDGVYYYIIKATCGDNNYVKKGFVTVLQ